MTPAEDIVRTFRDALPAHARHTLTLSPDVIGFIHAAIRNGHPPAELAEFVAYRVAGIDNAEQLMRDRLRRCAQPARPT